MSSEQKAAANGWGKWGEPGVPHKGWHRVDEFDSFEKYGEGEYKICGMCEKKKIRAIHVMEHDKYPDRLECGCVCSGHMSDDLLSASTRDDELKLKMRRRANFPNRSGWTPSKSGNAFINVEGYNIVIVGQEGDFKILIKQLGAAVHQKGKRSYATIEEARRGAFDGLQYRLRLNHEE